MKKLPKKLTLDCSTWRCGCDGELGVNALGNGSTLLRNEQGEMCCLGQFALQAGASVEQITNCSMPDDLGTDNPILGLSKDLGYPSLKHTNLTENCAGINDDTDTTIVQKIAKIRAALKRTGRTLVVKNLKKVLKKKK